MNKNDFSHGVSSIFRKTIIVLSGLILSLVLLEAGLRLGGSIQSFMQETWNLQSIKTKGVYRILCLGECTTRGYPYLLEQVLNQRDIGVRFSVKGNLTMDKFFGGMNTFFLLSRVGSYLDEYHPDMVVAMIGINDQGVKYHEDSADSDAWLFKHCRVYRFSRILYTHFWRTLPKKDIYGLTSRGSGGKAKPEVADTVPKKSKPRSLFLISSRFFWDEKYHRAENLFNKAVEINPKNDKAYVDLGRVCQDHLKSSQAEDLFKKAIEINPKNDQAYAALGQLYRDQGKYLQAEDFLKKAVKFNPENYRALIDLGKLYRIQRKFPEAGDALKKSIELNPVDNDAYAEFGALYREEGKFLQAEDLFKKALELNPGNDGVAGALLLLYEEMGKPELAKEYAGKGKMSKLEDYAAVTVSNYRKLKEILDRKGIKLVCAQYPMRNMEPLKRIFGSDKSVVFVDNNNLFREAVRQSGYKNYFTDMFAGDFGHFTKKSDKLLAQNIADVILREVFNK
jgi:tetratricopeptide (TPR) repeat protein